MKLTLSPISYYWSALDVESFYDDAIRSDADIIYLGEVVCSKRRHLRSADYLELAKQIKAAGKEVVISSLTLIEAKSEASAVKRLCNNGDFTIEANEYGAVENCIQQGLPFVAGPALNLYNANAVALLAKQGMQRWVAPVEMSGESLRNTIEQLANMGLKTETEVFVHGRLPLAYSARCFTARHHHLSKDDCQRICERYPEGLEMKTQERELINQLNGIQTQSGQVCDLFEWREDVMNSGATHARFNPLPLYSSFEAIKHWATAGIEGHTRDSDHSYCNGYWLGKPGIDLIASA